VRRDAVIVTNADYDVTLAAASVTLGAQAARHRTVISLLGDVLVHPGDWASLLASTGMALGIGLASSTEDAVYVDLDDEMSEVVSFREASRQGSGMEYTWTGVCRTSRDMWHACDTGHVFQSLERHLPIKSVRMRAQEVDFQQDLPRAEAFADRFLVGHVDGY
jgi:choline kinase